VLSIPKTTLERITHSFPLNLWGDGFAKPFMSLPFKKEGGSQVPKESIEGENGGNRPGGDGVCGESRDGVSWRGDDRLGRWHPITR